MLTDKIYEKSLFKLRFNFYPRDKAAFKDAILSLNASNADSFRNLLTKLNHLFRKQKLWPLNEAELSHTIFSSLKEYDCFVDVHSEETLLEKTGGRQPSADITVVRHDGVGIIIELKLQNPKSHKKSSAVTALNQTLIKQYYTLFQQGRYANLVTRDEILIGFYMTENGKFSLCYLANCHKLSNKICLE